MVALVLCGVSASTGELIASRAAQGFAAALLTPQVLAILGVVYSGAHRMKAFGASTRLDLPGVALLSAGLAALIVPLIEGRLQGWPGWTWLSVAASAVLLAAFAAHQARLERRGGTPLIRLELFTDRTFAIGVGIALTFCLGLASFWLVLALYCRTGEG